jgi:hypothetical protein
MPLNKGLLCLKYSSDLIFLFLICVRLITISLGVLFIGVLKQQKNIGLGISLGIGLSIGVLFLTIFFILYSVNLLLKIYTHQIIFLQNYSFSCFIKI